MSVGTAGKKMREGCRVVWVLLLALALLWSPGCGRKAATEAVPAPGPVKQTRPLLYDKELAQVLIYYATPDLRYLVPVTVAINPTREVAKTAVEKLLAGPPEDGLTSTMPEGVKLREVYALAGEKTAYVDFTSDLLKIKDTREAELALRSLVLTLTELEAIEGVRVMVEGQNIPQLAGVKLEETLKRPPAVNSLLKGEEGKETPVQVYFSDENALYLVPVTVAAPSKDEKELPRAAVEALLAGPPKDSGLLPTVWPGTKLLHFAVQDGVAVVDLSKEAVGYGGGTTMETLFVDSLLWTLTQFTSIHQVQLLIEGEKKEYLPEGTPIKDPLPRPEHLNMIYK
ncbi:GerMN domain-containing protein [Moorellaceae bacterium AZ2]